MMYDDSSGLLASQLANDGASNHNLAISQFDESSSLVGPSISLLPRQGEGGCLFFSSSSRSIPDSSFSTCSLLACHFKK